MKTNGDEISLPDFPELNILEESLPSPEIWVVGALEKLPTRDSVIEDSEIIVESNIKEPNII